jgi:hypothetical protein
VQCNFHQVQQQLARFDFEAAIACPASIIIASAPMILFAHTLLFGESPV